MVSKGCLLDLANNHEVDIGSESFALKFDPAGNLI
jgi:hypothetical protein